MKHRLEHDMLGELNIDSENYYGIHTQRAINNFKISNAVIGDYPLFIKSLILVKKACACANRDLKTIPSSKAEMIIQGCNEILNNLEKYLKYFPTDVFQGGAGTSVNMNTNEVIANVALKLNGYKKGEYDVLHPIDHCNKSQSTNDAYPTSFRVAVYFYINELLERIAYLANAIDKKATEFSNVLNGKDSTTRCRTNEFRR